MEQYKTLGENSVWEHTPSTRERPERGEEQEILRGTSNELHSPTLLQEDLTLADEEAKNDVWTITGEFIHRHHVEPRVKLYEESFPIPLKYIDVTRTTYTSLDVMLEKTVWWQLEGGWRKTIISGMDRLHKIRSTTEERPP